jgi:hypothetical protein
LLCLNTLQKTRARLPFPITVPVTLHHDKSGEPSAATDENKSNWTSTASATAKLLLRGVRDSADGFVPLKSVAGGLCLFLKTARYGSPPACVVRRLQVPQLTKANTREIGLLAPRVRALAESLCTPVSKGDVEEGSRRRDLEQ